MSDKGQKQMMDPDQSEKSWTEAMLACGLDAAVGRRFQGLLHNLNGVAQAFSMQTELLGLMYRRADVILVRLENAASPDEAREAGRELGEILRRRAGLVEHLGKEVQILQNILQRAGGLLQPAAGTGESASRPLARIVEIELEFLRGDGFFKHRVRTEVDLAADLPPLCRNLTEIHQILGLLLEKGARVLAAAGESAAQPPTMTVTGRVGEGQLLLSVRDNGGPPAPAELEDLFSPFPATAAARFGPGLYLARQLAKRCGGELSGKALPAGTELTLTLPLAEVSRGR